VLIDENSRFDMEDVIPSENAGEQVQEDTDFDQGTHRFN